MREATGPASHAELPPAVWRSLRAWAALWGDPTLTDVLRIEFSPRLRARLGRAVLSRAAPVAARVVLHPALRDERRGRLLSVLCHEAAHVAAWRAAIRDGRPRPQAHGAEWAALVRAAGYAPTTRAQRPAATPQAVRAPRPARGASPLTVAHVCAVCHSRRLARRAVPRWRCAACVAVGLDGLLVISRHDAAR